MVSAVRKLGRGGAIAIAAIAVLAITVLVAGLAGGGGSDIATVPGSGCKGVATPGPKDTSLPAPRQTVKRGEALTAVVKTSCGSFEIALDTKRAPKTVNSFAYLARQGFYDGLDFYKAISGFALYAGDPRGDGSGGPGYSVIEPPPAKVAYSKGVVAMAKTPEQPPGYSGSQFFIATSLETGLPPEYALLGRVVKGYSAVERINRLARPDEKTGQTVVIEKITIARG